MALKVLNGNLKPVSANITTVKPIAPVVTKPIAVKPVQPATPVVTPVSGNSNPSSTGTSVAERIERVKALFTGQNISPSLADHSDDERVQTIAADAASDMLLDFHDMRDITGRQFAFKNLTQLSVQQLDTYIEPMRVVNQIVAHHVPTKLTLSPVVMSFDEEGTPLVNGVPFTVPNVEVSFTDNLVRIGWLMVVKRRDILKGRTNFAVNNNDIFVGSYEVTNPDEEARFALLPSSVDTVLHMDGAGAAVDGAGGIVKIAGGTMPRQLSAFIDFRKGSSQTNNLRISGINAYVYLYSIPFTRETNDIISAAYVADEMDSIADNLLELI